jgi:hypothetical protein
MLLYQFFISGEVDMFLDDDKIELPRNVLQETLVILTTEHLQNTSAELSLELMARFFHGVHFDVANAPTPKCQWLLR